MNGLTRDPAEWARDWGWVSRVRAKRAAKRLLAVAEQLDLAFGAEPDDGIEAWIAELRSVAKYLAPEKVPAER